MNAQRLRGKLALSLAATAAAATVYAARLPSAHACGCFAQSNPGVPIVQAGERIVFAMEDGNVVAHIQIQYSGDPGEFGWLVPLPSLPDVQVGTDELFTRLIAATQPSYRINTTTSDQCAPLPPLPPPAPPPPQAPGSPGDGPLVVTAEIGPYSYAVLEADEKQPMLDWLAENDYFIPANSDTAVDPYIRPGGYFLAVKLQSGANVGDLQPIVLRYPSELPMIPIVLTSVGAEENMPVLVWVLGEARAIPRNYYHVEINDAAIDWQNRGDNYLSVVTRAVDEAEGHHAFITESAGPSIGLINALDYEGRYGSREELAAITDAIAYIEYLNVNGFGTSGGFFSTYPNQLISILERELPPPAGLLEEGFTTSDYYTQIDYFAGLAETRPELFEGWDLEFDPVALTDEIHERVVEPTLAAGALFRNHSYLTRLFTVLSPDEMNLDPVFSFNPDLPDVSNIHTAEVYLNCAPDTLPGVDTAAVLVTEQGWVLGMPEGRSSSVWPEAITTLPTSVRIEILREEGPPEVVLDNSMTIEAGIASVDLPPAPNYPDGEGDGDGDGIDESDDGDGDGGCAVAPGALGPSGTGGALAFSLLGLYLATRRRRPRTKAHANA